MVGKPAAIESWIRHGGSVRYVGSNLKTTKTGIGKNYEQSIFTKIVSNEDPPRRIKRCIALGLPAETGEPGGNDYCIAHNPR